MPLLRRPVVFALALALACRQAVPSHASAPAELAPLAVLQRLRGPVAILGEPPRYMDLRQRMRDTGVPAVSVAVVRNNAVLWSVAVGHTRADSGISVSPSTMFQAASVSKPLVALAMLRLVERRFVSLDDSANSYLRSWKIPGNAFTAQQPVTVGQLLSHTAGATNGAVGIYKPGVLVPTLLQALDGLAPSTRPPVRIDVVPGSVWRYAGGGYSIVQQLVEDVTGHRFPDFMREQVLAPARMSSSCFCQPLPDSLSGRAAAGHDADGRPIAGNWWTLPEMAAGGLWTTSDDLAHFVIAVNQSWNGVENALLRPATAHRMLTPGRGGWGLGFAVDTVGHALRYSHTGSNDGYRAIIVGFPARGDGIAILTNGEGGATIRDEILRAVAAEYGWPGYGISERRVDASANAQLRQFVGRFQYAPRFITTFELLGDSLVATLNAGQPTRVYSERRDEFFSLVGTTYRFVRGGSGEVDSVVARFADGSEFRGRRLDR